MNDFAPQKEDIMRPKQLFNRVTPFDVAEVKIFCQDDINYTQTTPAAVGLRHLHPCQGFMEPLRQTVCSGKNRWITFPIDPRLATGVVALTYTVKNAGKCSPAKPHRRLYSWGVRESILGFFECLDTRAGSKYLSECIPVVRRSASTIKVTASIKGITSGYPRSLSGNSDRKQQYKQ